MGAVRRLDNSKECPHCNDFFVPGGAYAAHVRSCASGGEHAERGLAIGRYSSRTMAQGHINASSTAATPCLFKKW